MQIDMSLLEGNISASVALCNVISFKGIASGVLSRGIISVKKCIRYEFSDWNFDLILRFTVMPSLLFLISDFSLW